MDETLTQIFLSEEMPAIVFILGVSMLRTIGLTFGFIAFTWGMGPAFMVRAGVAVILPQ